MNRWHLVATAIVAVSLRLPAVFNGLPYVTHPDEPGNYRLAATMANEVTPLPHLYKYPSLSFDLQALAHSAVLAVERPIRGWDVDRGLGLTADAGPGSHLVVSPASWVIARLLVLVVSVAGAMLVAHLGARLTGSRAAGAVGGLLAATSAISIASGSVITPDALAGTTALATIAVALRPLTEEIGDDCALRKWAITLGVSMGLATAAKYNNSVLAFPVAVHVMRLPGSMRIGWRQLRLIAGMSIVAFTLATPGLVFDTAKFVEDLGFELHHYATGHNGSEGSALTANLRFLWRSDGLAVALAATAIALRRTRATLLLASWPLLYLLVLGLPEVRFARNLTPILGCVALLGAVGAHELVRVARRHPSTVIAAVALVPVMAVGVTQTAHNFHRDITDHRADARRWLENHVAPGATVLAEYYTPWLDRSRWQVTSTPYSIERPDRYQFDAVILTATGSGRFLESGDMYQGEVLVIEAMRRRACRTERYRDHFGFWIEVLTMKCADPGGSVPGSVTV